MIKIEVKTSEVTNKTTKSGWAYRVQQAWAHLIGKDGQPMPYPVEIELSYWKETDQPYPPGNYTLDPSSLYVGDFRRLTLGTMKLRALSQPAQKAA